VTVRLRQSGLEDQPANMTSAPEQLTRRERRSESFDAQVKLAIQELLPWNAGIIAVARSLSISVRTLQRRLASVRRTYRQMLDECRREQAELALQRGIPNVTEISQRLGYSDPAHFVRAFRRWTGQAPTHFRAAASATGDTELAIGERRDGSPRE